MEFFLSRSVAEPEVMPQAFDPKLYAQLPPAAVMPALLSLATQFCTNVSASSSLSPPFTTEQRQPATAGFWQRCRCSAWVPSSSYRQKLPPRPPPATDSPLQVGLAMFLLQHFADEKGPCQGPQPFCSHCQAGASIFPFSLSCRRGTEPQSPSILSTWSIYSKMEQEA